MLRDYKPISHNALTILVNVSEDSEVVKNLIEDDVFMDSLLLRVTVRPKTKHLPPSRTIKSLTPVPRTKKNPTPTSNPCSSPT